jgi:hypothetical protein
MRKYFLKQIIISFCSIHGNEMHRFCITDKNCLENARKCEKSLGVYSYNTLIAAAMIQNKLKFKILDPHHVYMLFFKKYISHATLPFKAQGNYSTVQCKMYMQETLRSR